MSQSTPTFNSIGERVKYLQDEILKLTPNKFAKESGLAYNTLRSLYDSDKDPRRSTIKKILTSFDGFVNPAWLIEGKGKPTLSAVGEHPAFAKITSDEHWKRAGRLIRKKIRLAGKTTDQVAKAAGESKFFIEKTLRGQASPTPMLMGTLMLQTGTNLNELAEELGLAEKKEEPTPQATEQATPVATQEVVTPQEVMQEAATNQVPVGVTSQSTTTSGGFQGNEAQELRMKVEILANRVAYLEEKISRMAQ